MPLGLLLSTSMERAKDLQGMSTVILEDVLMLMGLILRIVRQWTLLGHPQDVSCGRPNGGP